MTKRRSSARTGRFFRPAHDPGRTFADIIQPFAKPVRAVALRLREIVFQVLPDAQESVHGAATRGLALYAVGRDVRVICGIQPRASGCLLYVHRVTTRDSGALTLSGAGRAHRYVAFDTDAKIDAAAIRALLIVARDRGQ